MNTPSTFWNGIDTTITSGSGGLIHQIGGYIVHEFSASSDTQVTYTFTPATTAKYEFFLVGNGGSGQPSIGGGGGGGEVVLGSVTLSSGSDYGIAIGTIGGYNNGIKDGATYLVEAYDGGTAGRGGQPSGDGDDGETGGAGTGGSGGGGAVDSGGSNGSGGQSFAANGVVNYLFRYGNDGGDTDTLQGTFAAGGGGAGGQGGNVVTSQGGNGGNGIANDWLGSTLFYGGGGGGYPSGAGNGGGGNAATTTNGLASTPRANSGGGGGGTNSPGTPGSENGARGIVLIRYRTSV